MKPTGIKFVVERKDKEITTWHTIFDDTVEGKIKEVLTTMKWKQWAKGKLLEAYLEFDNENEYYKVYIDCKKLQHLFDLAK